MMTLLQRMGQPKRLIGVLSVIHRRDMPRAFALQHKDYCELAGLHRPFVFETTKPGIIEGKPTADTCQRLGLTMSNWVNLDHGVLKQHFQQGCRQEQMLPNNYKK